MFEKGLLQGKRILITGGGSGLGAAMGRRFLELGAELIICGRRLELLLHSELANLASFLISDGAAYINGEMVVADGGAHLRTSGAEDLLQWTEAQWAELRLTRSR